MDSRLSQALAAWVCLLLIGGGASGCKPNLCPEGGTIAFYKEKVVISLVPGRVAVEGVYLFHNASPKDRRVKVYYPFPIDEDHPYPDRIEVDGFQFTLEEDGISWWMDLPACSGTSVKVRYQQRLYTNSATYILTTTQHWKRPLKRAEFIIRVPKNWGDLTISYPPDRRQIKDGLKYYYITRKNFMPDRDLVIRWP